MGDESRPLRGIFAALDSKPNPAPAAIAVTDPDSPRGRAAALPDAGYQAVGGLTPREQLGALTPYFWTGVHWERTPGEAPRMVREPLKPKHLERHLTPEGPYVGLAAIVPGESVTRVAVLDLDSHKGNGATWEQMREAAQQITAFLALKGIHAHPVRSSGGHGIHLTCLWDEPQDAFSVRELMRETLASCGLKSGTKGLRDSEVEINPKQDSVPTGGFGNMVILPLAGESCPLDADTFEPTDMMEPWVTSQSVVARDRPVREPVVPSEPSGNLDKVRSALAAITNKGAASLDYDAWRNVIFALHHATNGSAEGLVLAHEFSSRSEKYDPDFLDSRVWPYVRSDRGGAIVTERSLFNTARQHGYTEDVLSKFDDLGPEEPTQTDGGTEPERSRFAVEEEDKFLERPAPSWLIRGVIPRCEVMTTVGAAGAGKSFIVLDMADAVSRGVPWRGLKTEKGKVVYVAAEGAAGFRNRLAAIKKHRGKTGIGVISNAPDLLKDEDARELIVEIRKFGYVHLVIVDTLAASHAGDENSGVDMTKVLRQCKEIHKRTGGTVLLIHHLGKDAARGSRGWSGVLGAVDAELTVERDKQGGREVRATKMKDGVDGACYPFRLHRVVLNEAEVLADGADPVDSCVVEHLDAGQRRPETKEPSGKWQKAIWRHLNDLAGPGVGDGVALGELLTAVTEAASEADKPTRKILNQALAALQEEKQLLRVEKDVVYLAGAK